jgi:hypothetical protein
MVQLWLKQIQILGCYNTTDTSVAEKATFQPYMYDNTTDFSGVTEKILEN